jgi:hypothetical protein
MRYAVIENGVVVNVIEWDGETEWTPGDDYDVIDCPASVGPGWTYDGQTFTAPVSPAQPVRVTKADFQRLLTPAERYAINALRKLIATLPPAEYSDPANILLVAAEDVMFAFEQPAEFIELNHPDTYQGLMLLSYLGVMTPERAAEIVA